MATRIRAIVVDDIGVQRLLLRRLIELHPSLEWVAEAHNGHDALELIRSLRPDVIFLDMQMPGMNGFELINQLTDPPKIVFASAWPSYAVDAFSLDAIDYLLKPVAPDRFAKTVLRLERIFSEKDQPAVLLESSDRICLRTTERTFVVALDQIGFLKADGDFTWVHQTRQPALLACRRIGEFEESLPSMFTRLDRSLMINLDRVSKIERLSRNTARIWLHDFTEPLEIGRTATARLLEITRQD